MNINLTLIGQMVAFVAFVAFCMRYVWPPIVAAMAERQQKISEGLAAADRASHDLDLAKQEAAKKLSEAKKEAAAIVESANKRASQIVDESKQAAIVEADRVKAAATAEIEQERARTQEQLMAKVSELAVAGAEKILAQEIDAGKHEQLLKQLISEA
ncbi:ATP synthase F0, B subunit [Luminiphilus syltensis NOR5-1B]|uniref:ATP synthase subunit b n=1 Tax=Luminiphilus syltensis NOR5-1B TaxID=565045 RepID=B8KUD4_9GAMM|nr:F0F1 ATP synthase subunit B [Luminiphilus syltensis]EED35041.1 ATP synthase F0, B subunit [Luminiphilus syltensis NOR5-1B]